MTPAYHVVHYRKVKIASKAPQPSTLELLCRTALDTVDGNNVSLWMRATDRILDQPAAKRQIVLNRVADLTDAVFGEFCLVDTAGLQAMIGRQASEVQLSDRTIAQIFNLQERTAPQGSQFIRGMLYWLSIGNHLLFVRTQSFGSDDLQTYLNWMLRLNGSVLNAADEITIQARLDESVVGRNIGDIQSIRFSGKSLTPVAVTDATADDPQQRTRTVSRTVGAKMLEFAQALPIAKILLGETRAESLVNSLGSDEYIAVDATIKVRGKRTPQSKEALSHIVNDVAEMTEARVQVEGKDGKMSEGDAILRTRMPFELTQDGGNFLDFDNVADQLQEVYRRFVSDRKISVE